MQKTYEVIAQLDLPKQRCTAPISVKLIYNNFNDTYHTTLYNRETESHFSGDYDLKTFEEAFSNFQKRAQRWLSYSPSVYELADTSEYALVTNV